MASTVI